jgi:type IV secretory pathway TrbD component
MTTMERIKSFDWLGVIFYPLAVILMEVFWVSPWLSWVGVWPWFSEARPVLSLASVVIVVVVSLLVTRIFSNQKLSMGAVQIIIIGSGVVTMILVLAVEYADGYEFLSPSWFGHIWQVLGDTFSNPSTIVVAIPAIIYLWWRGIMLGQSTSYFKDIYRSFTVGMVALIVLIILWQVTSASGKLPEPGSDIGVNVIAFFFFGLLAIAICHLYNMRSTMPREEAKLTSVWRWVPIMLGVVGVMVLIGFGVASALSPDFFDTIGRGFEAIFDFLGTIFSYILWPFIYIFEGLAKAFMWFINLLRGCQGPGEEVAANMTPLEIPEGTTAEIPAIVTTIIKWFVAAVFIAVVIFILAKAISRYRQRRAKEDIDETRESLFSWRGLSDDLKLFFKMMGQRFQRKPHAAPSYVFDEDATGRLDIRDIFRHLQWESSRSGIPRKRHETAQEYTRRIENKVPDSSIPLNDLTGMYENVRYGEKTVPEERIDSANSIWQTLKGMIRKLRGD